VPRGNHELKKACVIQREILIRNTSHMNLSPLNDNELAEALIRLTGNERAVTLSILHHLTEQRDVPAV